MPVNSVTNSLHINLNCNWTAGVETISNNKKKMYLCFLYPLWLHKCPFPSTVIYGIAQFSNAVKIFLKIRIGKGVTDRKNDVITQMQTAP